MTAGKCPDCYGEGIFRYLVDSNGRQLKCSTCDGTGSVAEDILAQREAEYRAWLRKQKVVFNKAHSK